jgi:hypothetical protein
MLNRFMVENLFVKCSPLSIRRGVGGEASRSGAKDRKDAKRTFLRLINIPIIDFSISPLQMERGWGEITRS